MELRIIEQDKDRLKIEVKGENHTFCNLLRDELNNDKTVKAAGYRIEATFLSEPTFLIESNNPVKALNGAIERLRTKNENFRSQIKELKLKS